jgi:hypothetical protein
MAARTMAKNIIIYSDGTGQAGGFRFDEVRSNVYKLYRATRCGLDSPIDPNEQIAFYDPGLGSQADGANVFGKAFRWVHNTVAQATGFGITRNLIDCYAALIQRLRLGGCDVQSRCRWKSRRRCGRQAVPLEIRLLIREMSIANPLWERRVSMVSFSSLIWRGGGPPPSQGWKTFLRNHADGIAAMDLFVVPTIFFRPVYGLLIMGHGRP